MEIISVSNLTKNYRIVEREKGLRAAIGSLINRKYKTVEALKGINFTIEKGEIVGYIGPNGSGKTTTLKILSGLLTQTSGEVKVKGYIPFERKKDYKKIYSIVMGQKSQLWWDIPAIESFDLLSAIYEIPEEEYKERLDELTNILDVKEQIRKPVRNLSLGERMKMELIAALLHNPEILFLDEPTIGLDVVSQKSIRNFLKDINAKYNTTIILTSHYMKDIKELCNRVIVLNKGRVGFDGKISELNKAEESLKVFNITFKDEIKEDEIVKYGAIIEHNNNTFKVKVLDKNVKKFNMDLMKNYNIVDYRIEDVDIEDVIAEWF